MMTARAATFLGSLVLLAVLSGAGCRAGGDPVVASSEAGGPMPAESANPTTPGDPSPVTLLPRSGGFPAGESLEGFYVVSLSECLTAGRMTFQDQKIRLIRQEQFSGWAAIDGRYEDATPVRIKGEDVGEMRMKVVFTVGTRKGDLNRALVRALKEGFEARLLVASPRDP